MIEKLTAHENEERMKSPFWQPMKDENDRDYELAAMSAQCRLDNYDF